jgi:hypothetical protein
MMEIIIGRKLRRRICCSLLELLGVLAVAVRRHAFRFVDKSAPNSGIIGVSVERLPNTRLRAVHNLLQIVRD